jgi:hypothetical protein
MFAIVDYSGVGHPAFSRSDEHSIYGMDGDSQTASSSISVSNQNQHGVGSKYVKVRP